jgi:hypothetical protein
MGIPIQPANPLVILKKWLHHLSVSFVYLQREMTKIDLQLETQC